MNEAEYRQLKEKIDDFLHAAEKQNLPLEAICLSDHTGVRFVKHFQPMAYRNIYSHTKSFTSLMVGIALGEGKLRLEDHLVDFLPELSSLKREELKDITLLDLLTMRSGFGKSILMEPDRRAGKCYEDYLAYVLSFPLLYPAGTHFHYSNSDPFLASIMVSRAYGRPFYALCYEKVFQPMGMICPTWESDLKGNCVAATALFLSIEDMNKIGILFLNDGVYDGKRIVPSFYLDKLWSTHVATPSWGDYSFQFWHTPEGGALRADGLHGQYTFIDKKRDFALSLQRGEDGRQEEVRTLLIEKIFSKLD